MKFKVGDKVKFISDKYFDTESNPLWGGDEGQIAGIISEALGGSYCVDWENGRSNSCYNDSDLEFVEFKKPIGVRELNKQLL